MAGPLLIIPAILGKALIAGVATRYGARKIVSHFARQAIKKAKGKAAIKKARKIKKNIKTRSNMDVDKASWKKVYRGARELDGSYIDPGNVILRTKGKVNIGLRPIGKRPKKQGISLDKNPNWVAPAERNFFRGIDKKPKDNLPSILRTKGKKSKK